MSTTSDTSSRSLAERAVDRVAGFLGGKGLTRRRFLSRAAIVGTALAVNPTEFVLKPRSAYAATCGPASACGSGWTAFCCSAYGGRNTCPPGSYAAGWWKIDSSQYCRGAARYVIDCNRLPWEPNSCGCDRCLNHECDNRRYCCNNFRYGQCNLHIRGVTPVVCRVVTCAPPWEVDPSCTTTLRTDNRTADHTSTCLPGSYPSFIEMKYQDMGLVGSVLGREVGPEYTGAGGGRVQKYERGWILYTSSFGAHEVHGGIAGRYEALGAESGPLGYPTTDERPAGDGVGRVSFFTTGAIWWSPSTGAYETYGLIHDRFRAEGYATGWLGYPISGMESAPGGRRRVRFSSGWSIVSDPGAGVTRIYPNEIAMPSSGWPRQTTVERWQGGGRIETAVAISQRSFPAGAPVAFVARANDFADALTGGVAAALLGGPMLLTGSTSLPDATANELERLDPARIVVLGGDSAVSPEVASRLESYGTVERWAGNTRAATAAEISARTFPDPDAVSTVHVATGQKYADALSGVPAAAAAGGPLLLVARDVVPDETATELDRLAPSQIVLLGGEGVVSEAVRRRLEAYGPVVRRSGPNRFATSAAVAAASFDDARDVFVVTGLDFPDGLTAGPAAARRDAPVLLVGGPLIPAEIDAQMRRLRPDRAVVIGGERAVPDPIKDRFGYYVPRGG